jgi:hypothetical protein
MPSRCSQVGKRGIYFPPPRSRFLVSSDTAWTLRVLAAKVFNVFSTVRSELVSCE